MNVLSIPPVLGVAVEFPIEVDAKTRAFDSRINYAQVEAICVREFLGFLVF